MAQALEDVRFAGIQDAIRARDVRTLKSLWNDLVPRWDDRTFYDFVASSEAFSSLSFRHREVFAMSVRHRRLRLGLSELHAGDLPGRDGQLRPGPAPGGPAAPSKFPVGSGAILRLDPPRWPAGTSLAALPCGAPRAGVVPIARAGDGRLAITGTWGDTRRYAAVLVTCQSWLLTTQIQCEESVFSRKMWMALDRARCMQSSKTFVMIDRPFWKDTDPRTGRDVMSITLTGRPIELPG